MWSCPHHSLDLSLLHFLSSWRSQGGFGEHWGASGSPRNWSECRSLRQTLMLLSLPVWLQEVVSHCKKLTKKNKEQLSEMMSMDKQKGLKSLSKEKRQKLEAYQHLFYLLQVGLGGSAVSPTARGAVQGPGPLPPHNIWVSLVSLLPADTASVLGQADLPDAPEQVHQIHGVCDLYALQLRVQPTGGLSAAPALQSGTARGDQVGVCGCPGLGTGPGKG